MSHNHKIQRQEHRHDLEQIKIYLAQQGFQVVDLQQKWRHVTGQVVKDDTAHFFKLGSTEEIAKKTASEFAWNNFINDKHPSFPVRVPKSYESGEYNGLFWFTSELIDGNQLTPESPISDTSQLSRYLPQIAQTTRSILSLSNEAQLPNDLRSPQSKEEAEEKFLSLLNHWLGQAEYKAERLVKFIGANMKSAMQAPSHGSFEPWHFMIDSNDRLVLVDGEFAKLNGFKFYDLATFYHRTYTKLQVSDRATDFLKKFTQLYDFTDEEWTCFRIILAQRVVGGYMEVVTDKNISFELQHELEEKVLSDTLL